MTIGALIALFTFSAVSMYMIQRLNFPHQIETMATVALITIVSACVVVAGII